jgi:electron transfer flavoprotein-quinone oxidoreductase
MSEDKFDCIVVGAGFAGCAAAIRLAKSGLTTLLIERAERTGEKSLSGGVLWGHDLDEVVPDWWKEAPVERFIDKKRLTFLSSDSAFSIDFQSAAWTKEPYNGFSVLRSRFDEWLAKKAEEAGATLVIGMTIRKLHRENGRVCGVVGIEETDIIKSDAVIIADGANSRLALEAGLRTPTKQATPGRARKKKDDPPYLGDTVDPHWMAIGVKEVIKLPKGVIEDRFDLNGNSGFANEMVCGFFNKNGIKAGASLYTNQESVSLNLVIDMPSLRKSVDNGKGLYSYEMVEDLRAHPYVASLLRGGEVVEYGAHLIPEGGLKMMPRLYDSGVMITGDAAGLCFSNGILLEGMNYAVVSGKLAADTVIEAKKRGDFSSTSLDAYQQKLEASYVMKDLRRFKDVEKATWNERLHHVYPDLLAGVMKDMVTEKSVPKSKAKEILKRNLKKNKLGMLSLVRDALSLGRKL